jgi:hypothetical protein
VIGNNIFLQVAVSYRERPTNINTVFLSRASRLANGLESCDTAENVRGERFESQEDFRRRTALKMFSPKTNRSPGYT